MRASDDLLLEVLFARPARQITEIAMLRKFALLSFSNSPISRVPSLTRKASCQTF
jgi:hypothetical protein